MSYICENTRLKFTIIKNTSKCINIYNEHYKVLYESPIAYLEPNISNISVNINIPDSFTCANITLFVWIKRDKFDYKEIILYPEETNPDFINYIQHIKLIKNIKKINNNQDSFTYQLKRLSDNLYDVDESINKINQQNNDVKDTMEFLIAQTELSQKDDEIIKLNKRIDNLEGVLNMFALHMKRLDEKNYIK